jgi:hypothetical protein
LEAPQGIDLSRLLFTCTNANQVATCTCNIRPRVSPHHIVNHSSQPGATIHWSLDALVLSVSLDKSLGYNLLSVSQLLDEGFEVRFKMGSSRVLDSQGDLVCMIIPEGQIFRADFS